ncbi:MAG: aldehyde dehydrogenase family protein [Sphingobium sp.]
MKRNLINGVWRDGADSQANISPANIHDVIGHYARGSAADVAEAAAAARKAAVGWAEATPQVRSDLLARTARSLNDRLDAIGSVLAREEGKTLIEAKAEVARAAQIFSYFSGEALRLTGDSIASVRPNVDIAVTREPLGVVGLITPWNFPIAIPAWKIAPALAYGNTVILKPADLTPACAHILAEILVEAGCPAGVFNLVMGRGSEIGSALTDTADVDGISFTGSSAIGRGIAVRCAERLVRVQLEMGGKNPTIVMDDADLDVTVPACINSAFYSTGQRCTATSRFIVHAAIHDAFVERMCSEMQALVVGDPLDAATQMGPVVSERQLQANLGYVGLAAREGCEVIGGESEPSNGWFQRPAMFLNANNDMRVTREEIFGPCAAVIRVADFDEAIAVANDTEFGLAAGICTTSLRHARAFQRQSSAGMVMTNLPTAGVDYHVPFGGRRASSYGTREQGQYAREFYTEVKTSYCYAG